MFGFRANRAASSPASRLGLVLSILAIAAVWVAVRQSYGGIEENGYLENRMTRLVAAELRRGLTAGLYFSALLCAGVAAFYIWLRVLRLVAGRKAADTGFRRWIPAFALASWSAGYVVFDHTAERFPYPFPTTDIPAIAWAGIVLGAVTTAQKAIQSWMPRVRFGWLKKTTFTLGYIAAGIFIVLYGYSHRKQPVTTMERPNVLLIVMDTVRAQDLSLYGYERKTTPRLDAYAEACAVYDNAYTVASWTIPNHAALFTGLYTCQHGARLGTPQLRGVVTTLAEVLTERGFETVAYANNPVLGAGIEQGFGNWHMPWRRTFANLYHVLSDLGNLPQDEGAYVTGKMVARWLDQRDSSQPFFLFVNYLEAHSPYWPPESYRFRFLDEPIRYDANIVGYDWVAHASGARVKSPDESNLSRRLYDAEILYLDDRIGELLDLIGEKGLADNTLIIITSDHGDEFGEHNLVGHSFGLYNTLIKVPLIVRYPDQLPGARRYANPVQLIDLFPTILEATGNASDIPRQVQAQSLFGKPDRSRIYAENYHEFERFKSRVEERFPGADVSHYVATLRSLQIDNYKLISSSTGENELYRTDADPEERVNLAAREPERVKAMELMIEDWFDSTRTPLVDMERDDKPVSEEVRKKLRALGYLH